MDIDMGTFSPLKQKTYVFGYTCNMYVFFIDTVCWACSLTAASHVSVLHSLTVFTAPGEETPTLTRAQYLHTAQAHESKGRLVNAACQA